MNSQHERSLAQKLSLYCSGDVTALRSIAKLQPVGGPGSKVFPPTYQGGKYAFEQRWLDDAPVKSVLLDSVQSQANRMETALLNAFGNGTTRVNLPIFRLNIPGHGTITSLDVPHRVHDAILRDSLWDGQPFRQSLNGVRLIDARMANATALFEYCPTALLFGSWDSQGGGGVRSAKISRAIASEIVGIGVVEGVRTSSRIDPLGIQAIPGIIYKAADPTEQWTLDPKLAEKKKNQPVLFGKDAKGKESKGKGKPSEINHGNVTPTIKGPDGGGVTFREAIQTTVLSLTQLRKLSFPTSDGERDAQRDLAGRTALAALGLYAFSLSCDDGLDLRSRCHLVAMDSLKFEVIRRVLGEPEDIVPTTGEVHDALQQAIENARSQGLTWHGGWIDLKPTDKLLKLIQISDESTAPAETSDESGAVSDDRGNLPS